LRSKPAHSRGEATAAVGPEHSPAFGRAASGQRLLDQFVEAAGVRPGVRAEIESAGIVWRLVGPRRLGSRLNGPGCLGFGNARPKSAVL
jgi:hypothetical protein